LALFLDLFGFPAIIVVTLVLVLGLLSRTVAALLAPAIASALILVLGILAVTRNCDPAIQDCTVGTPLLVMFVWLVLVTVIGVAATLRLIARSRRPAERP
jgi:hypothetical protein